MISLKAKKEFIQFILIRHKFLKRECIWALELLLNNDGLLENVSFTEKASLCPLNMVISTTGVNSLPFRYETENLMTGDFERIYTDIRLREGEKLHIQLNYPNSHVCPMYANVFEDNPYLATTVFAKQVKEYADRLVFEMESRLVKAEYDRLIDAALDTGDDGAFMYLTGEFKKMEEVMK